MIRLHIEHEVMDFDRWKASFDSFAELRQKAGVRQYQILRHTENPNFVMIDLELDSLQQAETLLSAVQDVWKRVGGALIRDPQWRFSEVVASVELQTSTP